MINNIPEELLEKIQELVYLIEKIKSFNIPCIVGKLNNSINDNSIIKLFQINYIGLIELINDDNENIPSIFIGEVEKDAIIRNKTIN